MPMVHIQTLPLPSEINKETVLQDVIGALSQAIDTPRERIFGGWSFFALQSDGERTEKSWQIASHPPIVSVQMFVGRTEDQKQRALESMAETLREGLRFEGHPFVYISDIQDGHVMTGGRVIRR